MGCSSCNKKNDNLKKTNPYTIVDVVKDVLTGSVVKTSEELQETRKTICNGGEINGKEIEPCPHQRGPLCGQCGCIIALKVEFNRSQCPLGKW